MNILYFILISGLLALGSSAFPSRPNDSGPYGYNKKYETEPVRLRKEWRQLTIPERKDYTRAVRCLHKKPGIYGDLIPSSVTMFEDWASAHKLQTPYIHWESQFLPWHRYFIWTYENALRKECGYKGAQPYWDYVLDTSPAVLKDSPIFDVKSGFGGTGEQLDNPFFPGLPPNTPAGTGGGCQKDGPFKDWVIHIANQNATAPRNDRCLTRSINAAVGKAWCNPKVENAIKSQKDFASMSANMQGVPDYTGYFGLHLCGHFIVAGPYCNADLYVGPVDPLFFPHHANLDRIWWEWQQMDLKKRLKDVSGPLAPPQAYFQDFDYSNFPNKSITLDWEIDVGRLAPKVKVRELMDIRSGLLKVQYSEPPARH